MPITTQNGRVILKNGKASCGCCEGELFSFNLAIREPGPCACDAPGVACYTAGGVQAPHPLVIQSLPLIVDVTKNSPPFRGSGNSFIRLQGEIQEGSSGEITGWRNLVQQPTVVTLSINLGGGIQIFGNRSFYSPEPASEDAVEFVETPDLSAFDCGFCDTPVAGVCDGLQLSWVMYPNISYGLRIFVGLYLGGESGIIHCQPWLQGTLSGGGSPPP